MLKILLYTVLLVVVAVALAFLLGLGQDPGYLLIAWRNSTFESSLVAVVLAVAVLFVLFRYLLRLLRWLDLRQLLKRLRSRGDEDEHSRSRTTLGLIGYVRGDWEMACRELMLSFNDQSVSVVNYLAAAQAAQKLGREEALWIECLDKAAQRFPGSLSLIRETRAELLWKNDKQEEARAVLEQLERTAPASKHLLTLQKRIYLRLEDWDRVEELLPEFTREDLLSEEESDQLQKKIFIGRLSRLAEQPVVPGVEGKSMGATLMELWDNAPHRFHRDIELVTRFVRVLVKAGASEEASQVIESTLSKTWHDPLVAIYGEADLGNYEGQLILAEDWLQERPNDGVLLLALGRIAMRNMAWARAREYFETSSKLEPGAEVYAELARLLNGLGEVEASQQYFSKYLQHAETGLPDLPMPEHRKKKQAD